MDGSGDSATPQTPQNLNELQSLLVNFNKEIEDQPILVQSSIDQPEQQQIYIESSDGSVTSGTVEVVSSAQAFTGFYTEQNLLDSNPQDDIENQMSIVSSVPVEVHSQDILQDSLSTHVQISTDSTAINEECLQPGHNISIEGLQSQDLAALQDASGGVLRIVSIGNDGQMHIINEDQLQQGSEITSLSAEQLAENTIIDNRPTEEREANIIDGTDPVAVLASVAANTSSVSQLQSIPLNQGDFHNPQLVALQNSADSSQPQLVAVQNADGTSTEALQIIGGSDSTLNQALLSNANNSFQTVTLVPSETGPGGEVSYVLIMSSPDGDSVIDGKAISLDMSVYDFKEEGREITEEIVEEDGKTRRILRITPKSNFISAGQMMCSYCNYTSPKKYLLTRHMKTHSEERPHKCHICERGFKTMASLTNHVNTHTGIRPHKCKLCESAFTTSGELVRHVRYKHTFEKPHKCSVCEYASVELSKLKRHMRSHTGERPYACPSCSYASPDTYKLKRHLRIHTGEKPYECMICHARFTQSNSLKAHKLIHTGTKPVFQCEYCPTTCGRKTDLKIHVQKLHSSEHPLLCRKCGETLPDRYTYKIHIKTHEGEKCFKCDTCGHAALSQRHLDSHQLIHSGEKPFECESCDHSFRQKQLLKRHQSLHHSSNLGPLALQETAQGCQDCPKPVANKGNLTHPVAQSSVVGDTFEVDRSSESANSIITQNILEKNLMQEWRDGKLGNAQSVVIVHPDGTVEEVTHKLQGTQPVHIPHSLEEHSSIEPDLSQIVIKTEPGSDEIPIVISAIEAHDQTYDETKEAATQAEIESDGDDTYKNGKKDNITDQSSIQFLKEPVNIERLNDGTSEHMILESIDDSTSSELHVHPSETELDISRTELDHSDTKFDQQRTELTQSETEFGLLNQSESEVDQIENKFDPAEAKLDQPETQIDELEIDEPELDEPELDEPELDEPELDEPELDEPELDEPELDEPELDEPELDEPETELDYSVEVESNDEQPLILDTVEHSEFIQFTDVADIHPHDSESSYAPATEMIKDEATLRSSMNHVETVKEIPSPNRQTRSMKRKEEDYSKSPAKRTRKATADQN